MRGPPFPHLAAAVLHAMALQRPTRLRKLLPRLTEMEGCAGLWR